MLTGMIGIAPVGTNTAGSHTDCVIPGPQGQEFVLSIQPEYPADITSNEDLLNYIQEVLTPLAYSGWKVSVSLMDEQ